MKLFSSPSLSLLLSLPPLSLSSLSPPLSLSPHLSLLSPPLSLFSYLIFLNTTSSSLRCEPWELTAILLHHRRNISETGDCGLLDEYQIRLAIHCSSWRCSTIPRHTPSEVILLCWPWMSFPQMQVQKNRTPSQTWSVRIRSSLLLSVPDGARFCHFLENVHALHLASVNHSFTHSSLAHLSDWVIAYSGLLFCSHKR